LKNRINKLTKIINQWPVSLVALGGALTIAWMLLLAWFPVSLMIQWF
jgi:hypothetical protein